jgi:CxxC motif-containing protein (DUF1111 family)
LALPWETLSASPVPMSCKAKSLYGWNATLLCPVMADFPVVWLGAWQALHPIFPNTCCPRLTVVVDVVEVVDVEVVEDPAAAGQSNVAFQPYSDFALHDMGTGLADNVSQGNANGRQFRTAPLWGVGQRLFFLHDGRTNDLDRAIRQHASSGSEANAVINNYNNLGFTDKQALAAFLRSL